MTEDKSREALRILTKRIAGKTGVKASYVPRGNLFNSSKLAVHIQFGSKGKTKPSRVFCCVDSEWAEVEETQALVEPVRKELQRIFPRLDVKFAVVDRSLEGWLLCDHEAVRSLLGKNAQLPRYGNLETQDSPAKLAADLYDKNGHSFNKVVDNPKLAKLINLDTVAKASPTFRAFREMVRGSKPSS